MYRDLTLTLGAVIAIVAFYAVLWFTDRQIPENVKDLPHAEKMTILTRSAISDEASLSSAAKAAGVMRSPGVILTVEDWRRVGSIVAVSGWAFESSPEAYNRPVPKTILAFGEGKMILNAEAAEDRPDVATFFKFPELAAKQVGYTATLSCRPGTLVVLAVVTGNDLYGNPDIRPCP